MEKTTKDFLIKERIQLSIERLKELSMEFGRYPTVQEYDANRLNGYTRRDLEKHLGKSFSVIEKEYCGDFVFGQRDKRYNNPQEIIERLKKYLEGIDHAPTAKELLKNGFPNYNVISRLFDGMTYMDIVESLGYSIKGSTTKSYSKEKMLTDFRDYYNRTGKYITHAHNGDRKQKCFATYIKAFGTMENICKLSGVPYVIEDIETGIFGKYVRDLNNDLCQSIAEKEITDYFILNNIPYEKEYKYDNLIRGCRYVFDWKIKLGGNEMYVEYCGLYDKTSKLKSIQRYTLKVDEKIKILKLNNLYAKTIFIFPKEYKTKSLSEIFDKYI